MMPIMQVSELLQTAIEEAGSQAKLGKAIGCSQNAIWQAKNRGTVTGEMAVAIERVTNGKVTKQQLRPDLFAEASAA
jgi:DNA-binding transcriptional regulator YdaS (Cro superfamily)